MHRKTHEFKDVEFFSERNLKVEETLSQAARSELKTETQTQVQKGRRL